MKLSLDFNTIKVTGSKLNMKSKQKVKSPYKTFLIDFYFCVREIEWPLGHTYHHFFEGGGLMLLLALQSTRISFVVYNGVIERQLLYT